MWHFLVGPKPLLVVGLGSKLLRFPFSDFVGANSFVGSGSGCVATDFKGRLVEQKSAPTTMGTGRISETEERSD